MNDEISKELKPGVKEMLCKRTAKREGRGRE